VETIGSAASAIAAVIDDLIARVDSPQLEHLTSVSQARFINISRRSLWKVTSDRSFRDGAKTY
jgi:hypothetical protein